MNEHINLYENYPIKMNRFVSLAVLIDNVKTVKPKGRKEYYEKQLRSSRH